MSSSKFSGFYNEADLDKQALSTNVRLVTVTEPGLYQNCELHGHVEGSDLPPFLRYWVISEGKMYFAVNKQKHVAKDETGKDLIMYSFEYFNPAKLTFMMDQAGTANVRGYRPDGLNSLTYLSFYFSVDIDGKKLGLPKKVFENLNKGEIAKAERFVSPIGMKQSHFITAEGFKFLKNRYDCRVKRGKGGTLYISEIGPGGTLEPEVDNNGGAPVTSAEVIQRLSR